MIKGSRSRVYGLGFRVWGLGLKVASLSFRVKVSRFRNGAECSGFRVTGLQKLGFGDEVLGFGV
jgi:hypothetical protein